MTDRLFDLDDVPLVPLLRKPRPRIGATKGWRTALVPQNDYPPEWHRCTTCLGRGKVSGPVVGYASASPEIPLSDPTPCGVCLGMGSVKAMMRLHAGHRCERCKHPYVPEYDALMLSRLRGEAVEPSWRPGGWSACDERCEHGGHVRAWRTERAQEPDEFVLGAGSSRHGGTVLLHAGEYLVGYAPARLEAAWLILTVHHLDGDKANVAWWNLVALCQRCHLHIQNKVVMERVYVHEHSEWFKPHAAGYYAKVYLGLDLSRDEAIERMDELLALELAPA